MTINFEQFFCTIMPNDEDNKFMEHLKELEKESHCIRKKIAAIIVKNGKMVVEGCNNIPHDEYDCRIIGCIRETEKIPSGHQREVCLGLCAEQYTISKAAERGININNSTIYITTYPCRICCSLIVNAGIKKVVFRESYPPVVQYDILDDAGVEVIQYKKRK